MSQIDPTLEYHKERGWREVSAVNEALEEGQIDEAEWHTSMADLIRPAYLAAESVYAQAGHGGDAASWENSRGFIADALHQDGTFLDAGCANGILMESVQHWGAKKNLHIEPYGLDIVPEFVERTRSRLPRWADRIHLGNIREWQPDEMRFDYVMLRPEYAPAHRRAEMVDHVMEHVLQSDGRLIFFVGNEETHSRGVEAEITQHGFSIDGRVEVPHPRESRLMKRLFWVDKK